MLSGGTKVLRSPSFTHLQSTENCTGDEAYSVKAQLPKINLIGIPGMAAVKESQIWSFEHVNSVILKSLFTKEINRD